MCRYYFKTESSDGADRWTLGDRPPMGVSGGVDCNADDSAGAAGSLMCSWDDERTKQTTNDFEWCHKSQANCESYDCNRGSSSKWVRFHHRGCAGGGYSPQVCDESWGSPLAFCTFFGVGFPNFQFEGFGLPQLVRSWIGFQWGGFRTRVCLPALAQVSLSDSESELRRPYPPLLLCTILFSGGAWMHARFRPHQELATRAPSRSSFDLSDGSVQLVRPAVPHARHHLAATSTNCSMAATRHIRLCWTGRVYAG
jgi:hypothetical protein